MAEVAVATGNTQDTSLFDWWPEPVDREKVHLLKAAFTEALHEQHIEGSGPFAIALADSLCEVVADCAGLPAAYVVLFNLIAAMKTEVERKYLDRETTRH